MMKIKKKMILISLVIVILFAYADKAAASTNVRRIMGNDRYKTAVEVSKEGWVNGSSFAVLVTADNFPDALSAAPLAKRYNAPILLTGRNSLNSDTQGELKRLKVRSVYIIGGESVISKDVEDSLRLLKMTPIRIAGKNRYETSVKVAERIGGSSAIMVASGLDFADALSISPIAAKKMMPIILVPNDTMPQEIKDFLTKRRVSKAYVIGGEGSISQNVINQLPSPEKITGNDIYERNISAIEKFQSDLDLSRVYIATGQNYPDALAASVLAANTSSPLILVSASIPWRASNIIKSNMINEIDILGGTGAVSYSVEDELSDLPASIQKIDGIEVSINEKDKYELPKTVSAVNTAGKELEVSVNWKLSSVDTGSPGRYVYEGIVDGFDGTAKLTLHVMPAVDIIPSITAIVVKNDTYVLPEKIAVTRTDGTTAQESVKWDAKLVSLNKIGSYTFNGLLENSSKKATLTLNVVEDASIEFEDSRLENAIRDKINKKKGTLYKRDVLGITSLDVSGKYIRHLDGIVYLANLKGLDLDNNSIVDITPLENMTNLERLNLEDNNIDDITSLKNLTKLTYLNISGNDISNMTTLRSLVNLTTLYLGGNNTEDFTSVKQYYDKLNKKDFEL